MKNEPVIINEDIDKWGVIWHFVHKRKLSMSDLGDHLRKVLKSMWVKLAQHTSYPKALGVYWNNNNWKYKIISTGCA